MANTPSGNLGNPVLWRVVVVCKSLIVHVQILPPRSEELTAKGSASSLEAATKMDAPVNVSSESDGVF